MTDASIATTAMPCRVASLIAGVERVRIAGLMRIAFTSLAIRSRMSASWPAASVSLVDDGDALTLPDLTAWALAEQIMASRQPLPTPPGFENPIV